MVFPNFKVLFLRRAAKTEGVSFRNRKHYRAKCRMCVEPAIGWLCALRITTHYRLCKSASLYKTAAQSKEYARFSRDLSALRGSVPPEKKRMEQAPSQRGPAQRQPRLREFFARTPSIFVASAESASLSEGGKATVRHLRRCVVGRGLGPAAFSLTAHSRRNIGSAAASRRPTIRTRAFASLRMPYIRTAAAVSPHIKSSRPDSRETEFDLFCEHQIYRLQKHVREKTEAQSSKRKVI